MGLGIPILSIHINNDMKIDIVMHMNIDNITPPQPMPGLSADKGPGQGHGLEGAWGDINIHTDINMNFYIHIIINRY